MARPPDPRPVAPQAPPGCRYIALTRGKFALVDEDDYTWLNKLNWRATLMPTTGAFYATHSRFTIQMHAMILGLAKGEEGDHKNRDTLDNRRENLRRCTSQQNKFNQGKRKHNKSGYIGVAFYPRRRKWRAVININKRLTEIGCFDSPVEAARAYDAVAIKTRGEFAVINFPQEKV